MSQFQYAVTVVAGDIVMIIRLPNAITQIGGGVLWSDPDFQSWNAAQPTPYVLSTNQIQLQQLRTLTAAQLANATPAQIGFLFKKILDNLNTGVI